MDSVAIAGHVLYARPGFHIGVYANVGGVRAAALGPDGAVYATRPGAGTVVRLPDHNGDGVADSVVVFAGGLSEAHGLAWRGDTLYVAENPRVVRFIPPAWTRDTVVGLVSGGGHWTRTIAFGPDGKMYVAAGSSCNICTESDPRRAAVTQFNPDGSGEHIFASGLRNSVGLAFDPATGALWATNNDRDDIGSQVGTTDVAMTDSLPPERINILVDGKNYGWPLCYLPNRPNPEFPAADCSAVQAPAITFTAHSAPLGLAFYTGTMFPADYQGDVLVAFHGSWDRSVPTGAKVVRVHVQGGLPVSVEDFIVGWQLADGSRWGRPVGILVLADGSVLVTDDTGGKVWRITYAQ
jgi:glucose/arabinose dehydrogenase